jgi:hypothetical protein
MKSTVTLRDALNDPQLLGHALQGESFFPWRTLLIAAMGEPLISDEERAAYTKFTGRDHEPGVRVSTLVIVGGRRSGKSRALATLSAYIGGLCDWHDVLVPGEVGVLLALAQSQQIAKQILNYCEADFAASPILSQLIVNRTAESIELKGNISIQVRPASMKKLRGPTYIGILADELAFWFTEEHFANPDSEIIAAVTPGLLTTRGITVMASSPYARKGVLWNTYKKHYGPDGAASVLVAQGTTRDFNKTVPQAEIDRLLEEDPARNRAEYLAEFRTDLESLVAREAVEACIAWGIFERPFKRGIQYWAFTDAATGSGQDSYVLVIVHLDGESVIVDAIREQKPPFSPEQTSKEFAELMLSYGISFCLSDNFAGEAIAEQLAKFGVRADQSSKAKSELYLDMLTTINSTRVVLLDHPRSISQIISLERSNRSGGRANIDAPRGQHEDIANAIAGAINMSLFKYGSYNLSAMGDSDENDSIMAARQQRRDGGIHAPRVVYKTAAELGKSNIHIPGTWPPIDRDGNLIPNNYTNYD